MGRTGIERVQHNAHNPCVDLQQEITSAPQGGLCGLPGRATRMTRSASGDKSTASVTDKHGGVSMMTWSNSLRQRAM